MSFRRPDVLVLGGGGVLGEAWMMGVLAGIEDATGFDLRDCEYFVGTSAGEESFKPVPTVLDTGNRQFTTATVTGLDPRKTYYFRVAAVLKGGEQTAYSNEAHASPHGGFRF